MLGVLVGGLIGAGSAYFTARLTVTAQQSNDRTDALRSEKLTVWGDFVGQIVTTQQATFDAAEESDHQIGRHPADVKTLNSLLATSQRDGDALCAATGRIAILGPSSVSRLADKLCSQFIAANDALGAKVNADINQSDHAAADGAFDSTFAPIDKTRTEVLTAMRKALP